MDSMAKRMDRLEERMGQLARPAEAPEAGRTVESAAPQEAPRSGTTRSRTTGRSGRARSRGRSGASRRARAGPTREEDEDIRSLSRIYDSQPRTFSLRERERIVRKARETLEAVEEGPVLPPVEYAAVEDGDVMDEPVLEPPERAFVSTPEHLARYLREM